MKCPELRRWLLKAEDPDRLSAEARVHLAGCPRCRRLYQHLHRIEQNVPVLPVPASTTRADFLQQFLAPPPPPVVTPSVAARSPVRPWRYLSAVAAAVLFLAISVAVFFAFRSPPESPPQVARPSRPLLDSLFERDLRLARATTPRERVEVLAALADDLQGETRLLAPDADVADLDALAQMYGDVVRDGIVPRARELDLPPAERRELLRQVADRLAETAGDADRRSKQVPESASALRAIALAARDGDGVLRQMIQEERP